MSVYVAGLNALTSKRQSFVEHEECPVTGYTSSFPLVGTTESVPTRNGFLSPFTRDVIAIVSLGLASVGIVAFFVNRALGRKAT